LSSKRRFSTFCAAALVLVALILAACKRPDPVPGPKSSALAMEFLTDSFRPDEIPVPIEQADEFGVDLEVNGLCAIDKDVAFLFGGVRVAAGTMRSFLLQTSDGGKSWHESMPPVLGSQLVDVAFSDSQHGWALAQWAVEGPGAPQLFGSTDAGKTWRELTYIRRSQGHPSPGDADYHLRMTFTSALNGEIELAEPAVSDDQDLDIETLATDDGGVTWRMVRRETRKPSPVETEAAQVEAETAQHDRGFDSTEWELRTRGYGEPITIRRFDREQSRWHVTALPTHFPYQRGRVLTSP